MRYTITVTEEQLAGLKHALAHAQSDYETALPKREDGVSFWEQHPDQPEKAKYLAMARENLEYVRRNLALVTAAHDALYCAKPVIPRTPRRGDPS